ncbi:MAG: YcaO-like family protein [Deltaproteobacteria bacterium]|jgi:ribosomal protein S12 methylthiotransferase accessory factor|nr:YcaO-like family protein [Deltaproteobacteria bacterium]
MNYTVILNDAYKKFTTDQDKILRPEETVKRFKDKLKTLELDILKSAIRIDNGRLDIPVYFSTCGKDAAAVTGTKKQMGKGGTPQQAEASALMELAERFSFFSFARNSENFFTDIYPNVKDRAISFELIAQSVHDDSEDLPVARKIFESLPLKWTWGYNLTREEAVLIPFDWFYAINEFNGPSAGNCVEEALIQGICEVVERHTSSVVSQNKLKVAAIRPESVTDPLVKEMFQKYKKAGVNLYLSDFSLDTGIPTVGAMAYDPATFPALSEIVWTAGTTPDPQKALSRALTEVAQLAGDFNTDANYVASGLPKYDTLEAADYIMNPGRQVDISALPDLSSNNLKTEIINCLAALEHINLQVIVINTMHQQLQVPAFYTIIPGAHFRERSLGTSVGMFTAKHIFENQPPPDAIRQLKSMDDALTGKYYINFYLGACHLSIQDPETAMAHFRRALALDPTEQDIASIHSYLGVALKDMGEYRQALDILQQGAQLDHERTDIYNLMGFCHFKLQEHEAAIENFKKVIALDPSSAIDYANIGANYRQMGEKEKAIRYYQMALTLDDSIQFAKDGLEELKG